MLSWFGDCESIGVGSRVTVGLGIADGDADGDGMTNGVGVIGGRDGVTALVATGITEGSTN